MKCKSIGLAVITVLSLIVGASAVADSTSAPPALNAGPGVRLTRIEGSTSSGRYIADPSFQHCGLRGLDATGDNGSFWTSIYRDGYGNWYVHFALSRKGGLVYWYCIK